LSFIVRFGVTAGAKMLAALSAQQINRRLVF